MLARPVRRRKVRPPSHGSDEPIERHQTSGATRRFAPWHASGRRPTRLPASSDGTAARLLR
jgi:hypothetical protein